MRSLPFSFLVLLFFLLARAHRPISQVLAEEGDLLAYFPFDENFNEATNKVSINATSPPELLKNAGFTGGSVRFDGLSTFIRVNLDIRRQKFPNFTFGCFARAADVGSHVRWLLSNDNLSLDRSLGIDFRSGRWGWSALNGQKTAGGLTVKTNTWQFVAVTFTGTVGRLFVDDRYTEFLVSTNNGTEFFHIGRAPCCGQFWLGEIDNVFVYGNALGIAQMEEIRTRFIQERLLLELKSRGKLLAFYPFEKTFGGSPQLTDLYSQTVVEVPKGSTFQSVKGFNGNALRLNGTQFLRVTKLDISGGSYRDLTMGCWARTEKYSMTDKKALIHNNFDRILGTDNSKGGSGFSTWNGRSTLGGLEVHTNEWQFVAVSFNNKERAITIVTDEESKMSSYHISFTPRSFFDIGRNPSSNTSYWEGDIDNVFIIDTALKAGEMWAIKKAFIEAKLQTEGHRW